MGDVTHIISEIQSDEPLTSERMLPLVYQELRRLATQWLAKEAPGQTLQATALVHEAYVRLVTAENRHQWQSRGHFFAAAAQAMRRILVENARRRACLKRGAGWDRVDADVGAAEMSADAVDLVQLDQALVQLAGKHPRKARLVELRFFSGLTTEQAAEVLGISEATAYRDWAYAKAWLHRAIYQESP